MDENCPEHARLQREVEDVLQRLKELTASQLQAFRSRSSAEFARLDRELENTIGEKERAFGALRQHIREHHCQPGLDASELP